MSLQLYLGESGCGKSYAMYKSLIKKSIEQPNEKFILIVPEQFTMETQRDIVNMHPNHGTLNIDIKSFNRLSVSIFDELNVSDSNILEDFGKSMVIRKILDELKDDLLVYKNSYNKDGFIDEAKSVISEMLQYRCDNEVLEHMLEEVSKDSVLYLKLHDIKLIYDRFLSYINSQYILSEQNVEILAQSIKNSRYIKSSYIYFDGFTGFTPLQYEVIEKLALYSKQISFALTIDTKLVTKLNSISSTHIFNLSRNTIIKLHNIAITNSIDIDKSIYPGTKGLGRHKNNEELAHLGKSIFRYPITNYAKDLNSIYIDEFVTANDEISSAARRIRSLVKDQGYRYRDIALVTGDLNYDSDIIKKVFKTNGIPFYIDENKNFEFNSCTEVIDSLIDMILEDFSFDTVFRYLKTGIVSMELSSIDELENYVLQHGMSGYKWWTNEIKEKKYKDRYNYDRIENCRIIFINSISQFRSNVCNGKHSVHDYIESIKEFLVKNHIEDYLEHICNMLKDYNDMVMLDAYGQVLTKLYDVFDKYDAILGSEILTLEEFKNVLMVGFEDVSLGTLPASMDQIIVGDITRTRLNHIKALFVLGTNEGLIPAATSRKSLLSDTDKTRLLNLGYELAPSDKDNSYIGQLYIYLNFTKPSNLLYISYRKNGADMVPIRPSYIINHLINIFPRLTISKHKKDIEFVTPADSKDSFIYNVSNDCIDETTAAVYKYYLEHGYNSFLETVRCGLNYTNNQAKLSFETAIELYGKELNNSISKLEKYASCPYSYFLLYGLQIDERKEHTVELSDMGTILHGTMEKLFIHVHDKLDNDWEKLSDEDRVSLTKQFVKEAAYENNDSIFDETSRNQNLLNNMTNVAIRTTLTLHKHILSGRFVPEFFEKEFSKRDELKALKYELNHGINMNLKGVIDRIDIYKTEDTIYVKIIDYKSGDKDIEYSKLKAGTQIQLFVYMDAALELLKKRYPQYEVKPAGLFYYHFTNPFIQMEDGKDIDIEDAKMKNMRLKGIVNSNEDIVKLIDREVNYVLPISVNKDGEIKDSDKLINEDSLYSAFNHTRKVIKELGNSIVEGNIDIQPIEKDGNSPCSYCNYKRICGFDMQYGNNSYKHCEKINRDTYFEELKDLEKEEQ